MTFSTSSYQRSWRPISSFTRKIVEEEEVEDVEMFLIDVIKTKLIRNKLNQDSGVIYVCSTMYRTFGPGEWQQLLWIKLNVMEDKKKVNT